MAAAERVSTALKMAGLTPIDVSCRIDRFGRMTVEIETVDTNHNSMKKHSCSRKFQRPAEEGLTRRA